MWDRMWDRLASRSPDASVCWQERVVFGACQRQRTSASRRTFQSHDRMFQVQARAHAATPLSEAGCLCPRSAVRSRPRGMTGRERAARTRTSTALRRIAVLSGERRAIIIRSARRDVCARVLPPAPFPTKGRRAGTGGKDAPSKLAAMSTPCVAAIAVLSGATRRRCIPT